MIRNFQLLFCLFFLHLLPLFSSENLVESESHPVTIEMLSEENSIQLGCPFWIALRFTIENHWHIYWKNPGDAGMPILIKWDLPKGFEITTIEWPSPQQFIADSFVGFGYERESILLVQITPSSEVDSLSKIKIGANLRWVACSEEGCLPGNKEVSISLPLVKDMPVTNQNCVADFTRARTKLPLKNWEAKVENKDGLIELTVQAPSKISLPVTKAYFFPEEENVIDYKAEMALKQSLDFPGRFDLILKKAGNERGIISELKGVLVLSNESGASQAVEIVQPISSASISQDSQEIGMVDSPTKKLIEPISLNNEFDNPEEFEGGFVLALTFAFLGGVILNLMPCVLPVISLKILSFVKLAGQCRRETLKHGIAFAAGVILSFWILATILLLLQSYGQSVGWGFQLQQPVFVAILAAIIFTFGLSLFGLFEIGTSITSLAGQAQINHKSKSSALVGSFMSGILATALATPCTGPFLGPAIGFAVTLPALYAITVFTFLGLGMAFPYLLLAAFPSFLRFLPKPGAWMVTFKEIMGFLMMATVLWLLWVFGVQTNIISLISLLSGFLVFALGGWIYGKWGSPLTAKSTRLIAYLLTITCVIIGGYAVLTSIPSEVLEKSNSEIAFSKVPAYGIEHWEEFSEKRLDALQKLGVPVFIDFTAKWCLICQANHLVLSLNDVSNRLAEHGVVKMKADWTKNDPAITQMLNKFGRNGVPLYILYGKNPDTKPLILPQLLTPENIFEAINKIQNKDDATL
jgi:thiol:disulfide interchange protein/DsbC/DsbD-like thiol-disulfide interchange protein